PTTGRLFSITYHIVGSSSGTPISYPTGCTSSSVSGTTTCVAVSNAGTVVPENVQGATFSAGPPPPDFTISAAPASLSVPEGSCGTSSITVASFGNFNGTVALRSSVSPAGPTQSISPTSVPVPPGGTASATLLVCSNSSTPPGSYADTV